MKTIFTKMKNAMILSALCLAAVSWTAAKGNFFADLTKTVSFENVNKINEAAPSLATGKITLTLQGRSLNIVLNSPDIKITDLQIRFYDKKKVEMSGGEYDKTLLEKYNNAKVNKKGFQIVNHLVSGKIGKKSKTWTFTIKTSDGNAYQVTKKIRRGEAIKDQLIINFEKATPCVDCFK